MGLFVRQCSQIANPAGQASKQAGRQAHMIGVKEEEKNTKKANWLEYFSTLESSSKFEPNTEERSLYSAWLYTLVGTK